MYCKWYSHWDDVIWWMFVLLWLALVMRELPRAWPGDWGVTRAQSIKCRMVTILRLLWSPGPVLTFNIIWFFTLHTNNNNLSSSVTLSRWLDSSVLERWGRCLEITIEMSLYLQDKMVHTIKSVRSNEIQDYNANNTIEEITEQQI